MENASKALVIAGSMLISLLVASLLIFSFGRLSDVEQTKVDAEETSKLIDYNRRVEQYNRTIYGSELLSLANLVDDYTKLQSELKGYEKIDVDVKVKSPININGDTYFSQETIEGILNDKNKLENQIEECERKLKYKGKTVQYYATKSYKEIALAFGYTYDNPNIQGQSDYEVGDYLKSRGSSEIKRLLNDIDEYKLLKSSYTEFKSKRFKCEKVEYGQAGRVSFMKFTEI